MLPAIPRRNVILGTAALGLGGLARGALAAQAAPSPSSARPLAERLAAYADVELLVKVGEYKKGSDADADMAIAKYKPINAFLQQGTEEFDPFDKTLQKLKALTR